MKCSIALDRHIVPIVGAPVSREGGDGVCGALITNIKYILVKHPYGRSMLEKRNAKRSAISSF